jgi:hypothetical protein
MIIGTASKNLNDYDHTNGIGRITHAKAGVGTFSGGVRRGDEAET